MIPDGLPTLSHGSHDPDEGEACVMEMVSLLAGEPWSDEPTCTHKFLAWAAQGVNDALPDEHQHLAVPLIGRLFDTYRDSAQIRAALYEYAEPDYDALSWSFPPASFADDQIAAVWLNVGHAVTHGDPESGIEWLSGLIDAYDKAAGRTSHRELSAADLALLAERVSA